MFQLKLFVMKQSFKKLNPWYVTGLCDGEATFTYSRTGLQSLVLYFALKLGEKDKSTLKEIQTFFGVGKIYLVKYFNLEKEKEKSGFYYRVTKLSELEKIIEHFDRYPLRTQKAKSYQVWREMVFLKKKNFRKPSSKELENLAQKLATVSRW